MNDIKSDKWECIVCGKDAPCRVEIVYETTQYPHVEAQSRFRDHACLCGERFLAEWHKLLI